jgi:uncharacterized membrane protein YkgB
MKRFVRVELRPCYALIVIGVLIELLTRSIGMAAHLAAFALAIVGIAIVFGTTRLNGRRQGGPRALLGAGRSRGNR